MELLTFSINLLNTKTLPAPAGALNIGVPEDEAGREFVRLEVHLRAEQTQLRFRVDPNSNAVLQMFLNLENKIRNFSKGLLLLFGK